MNIKQIASALKMTDNKANKAYLQSLVNIAKLICEVSKLPDFRYNINQTYTDKKSNTEYNEISISHSSGSYLFNIPTGNNFANYVYMLIGHEITDMPAVSEAPIFEAIIDNAVITKIKTALTYVGKDTLRPQFTGVCLDFIGTLGVKVVATDGHKLYVSEYVNSCASVNNGYQLILPVDICRQLISKKLKNEITLQVFKNKDAFYNDIVDVEGITGLLVNGEYCKFVDYAQVIPDNYYYFNIDRSEFLRHLSVSLPCANKVTSKVILSLNGNVKIDASEIDLSQQSITEFNYLSSNNNPDNEIKIAFSGKRLVEILKCSKEKIVTMRLQNSEKCAVFQDSTSDINLIMPYYLGND